MNQARPNIYIPMKNDTTINRYTLNEYKNEKGVEKHEKIFDIKNPKMTKNRFFKKSKKV